MFVLEWIRNKSFKFYYNRGVEKKLSKAYSGALADFEEALKYDPSNTKGITEKAITLGKLGHSQTALELLDKTLAMSQLSMRADLFEAKAFIEWEDLGKHESALENFNKAIELCPGNALYHFNKATLLKHHLDRREDALRSYADAFDREGKLIDTLGFADKETTQEVMEKYFSSKKDIPRY